jgi:hypothetical protein
MEGRNFDGKNEEKPDISVFPVSPSGSACVVSFGVVNIKGIS